MNESESYYQRHDKLHACQSPTGMVHAVETMYQDGNQVSTLCNHMNYNLHSAYAYEHNWPIVDKPVTCKRCLKLMRPKLTGEKLVLVLSPYTHADKRIQQAWIDDTERHLAWLLDSGIKATSMITGYHHMFAKHNLPDDYKYWESFCKLMIEKADKIIVMKLPGWDRSKGMRDEVAYAEALGKEIEYV